MLRRGDDLLSLHMATTLGKDLVFKKEGDHSGILEHPDGPDHICHI